MLQLFRTQAKSSVFETISLSLFAADRFLCVRDITEFYKYGEH